MRNLRRPVDTVPKSQNSGAQTKTPATPPTQASKPGNSNENPSRLEALIGSIDEIVFELAPDGTFLNIWTTNEELLYRPRHELLGKRVSDVIGEDFSGRLPRSLTGFWSPAAAKSWNIRSTCSPVSAGFSLA